MFDCSCIFPCSRNALTLEKKPQFFNYRHGYLDHAWPDKSLKGTILNRTCTLVKVKVNPFLILWKIGFLFFNVNKNKKSLTAPEMKVYSIYRIELALNSWVNGARTWIWILNMLYCIILNISFLFLAHLTIHIHTIYTVEMARNMLASCILSIRICCWLKKA